MEQIIRKRKQYKLIHGEYRIIATQHNGLSEYYTIAITKLPIPEDVKKRQEWIRAKTSPFMDGIKNEMCFFVHLPIDDTIPLSEFNLTEF